MSFLDDIDWTGKTGVPPPDPGNTFTLYVGKPSKCFRVHKGLIKSAVWIAGRIRHAQHRPQVEHHLRTTVEYLETVRRNSALGWHPERQAICGVLLHLLRKMPTELLSTATDEYLMLLAQLHIRESIVMARNVFDYSHIDPKLLELFAENSLPKYDTGLNKLLADLKIRLQRLRESEPVSADCLFLPEDDPEIVTLFIRALWSNKLQAQAFDGQLGVLSWSELVSLHTFAKRMGAEVLLAMIVVELQTTLRSEPCTDTINAYVAATADYDVRQLCELELLTRKLQSVGMSKPGECSSDDWEIIEPPQDDECYM